MVRPVGRGTVGLRSGVGPAHRPQHGHHQRQGPAGPDRRELRHPGRPGCQGRGAAGAWAAGDQLTPFGRRLLGQGLHLQLAWRAADKSKRDPLRAVTFLEVLLFGVPPAIVNRCLHETDPALGARIGALPGALHVRTEGRPDLGRHRPLRAEFGMQRPAERPAIRQPAKFNAGMPHDHVAVYARGVLDSEMDAAVAYLDPLVRGVNRLPDGRMLTHAGGPLPTGEPVYKWGAMSGLTSGWLGPVVDAAVGHAKFSARPIQFRGQLQVAPRISAETRRPVPFQVAGDSGSVLFDRHGRILGLLHGGVLEGLGALASPIDDVFRRLDVHFDNAV